MTLHSAAVGLPVIGAQSRALATIVAATDPRTPVTTCGEWSLADLAWHLAEVQTFWAHIITNRPAGPHDYVAAERPDDAELTTCLSRATDQLLDSLDGVDPGGAAWSWSPDHTVAFTLRRQSHEALIHHLDGVIAAGTHLPEIDPLLAADGVDEILTVMLTGVPEWATFERSFGRLRFAAADTLDAWTLAIGWAVGIDPESGTSREFETAMMAEEADLDATVTGTAIELDLWLWGRPSSVVIEGDPHLAERIRSSVK